MMGWLGRVAIGAVAIASVTAEAEARITHLEITKTEPAFGGQSFGDAGRLRASGRARHWEA